MFAKKELINDCTKREKGSTGNMFRYRFWAKSTIIVAVLLSWLLVGCDTHISLGSSGGNTTTSQETMTAPLSAVKQIYVCDETGSVVVRPDSSVNVVTINIKKIVQGTDASAVAQKQQALVVSVQNIKESACSWLPKNGDGSTLVVNATSPDDKIFLKGNKDEIGLEILLPSSMVTSTSSVTTRIEAGNNIDFNGFGGGLNLLSQSGNVVMGNVFLSANSTIHAQSGDIAFNGMLSGNNTQNEFRSNTGNINITLPTNTNVTVDASAPVGKVSNSFSSPDVIQETAAGAWYKGPLNSGMSTIAPIQLKLTADTGDVVLDKA